MNLLFTTERRSTLQTRIIQLCAAGWLTLWIVRKVVRSNRKFDIAGRTVLVTGGSRGLGLALARELASRKARVAICARNSVELETARKSIAVSGGVVRTFVCDVTDKAQVEAMIFNIQSALGPIDMLINNAGRIIVGPAQLMTTKDFQDAMDTNFWAGVNTTLAVMPAMKSRGSGRIINIASVGGKMPVPHLAAYCASKFAMVGFSTSMRSELARDGILVTTVNPGMLRTGSPRNASFKGNHQAEYAWFSLGDSLPGLSMSAQSAARQIVDAGMHGDGEIVLGPPAKLAVKAYSLFPNLHSTLSAFINLLLPGVGVGNNNTLSGQQSETWITRSFLRKLGHRAEQEYNQLNSK